MRSVKKCIYGTQGLDTNARQKSVTCSLFQNHTKFPTAKATRRSRLCCLDDYIQYVNAVANNLGPAYERFVFIGKHVELTVCFT